MSREGHDAREKVERLEEVKDYIVEFLERAPIRDAATRSMWIGDAKEAFSEVLAAYEMLPSDAPAFLQMAKSRVKQVSSELRTFKTDVAEDLVSRLQEAFEDASEAISSRAGRPLVPAPGSFPTVERTGEDHYTLRCSSCGQAAAVFRVEVPRLSTTGEEAIAFEGLTKSTHFDMTNERAVFGRLESGDLSGLNAFIEGMAPGGLDSYCPACDKVYCRDHYDLEEEWDEGFYDCTYGTCPEGHRRLLDD
jgi:hypothetical protein